jgi:ribosomal protein S20
MAEIKSTLDLVMEKTKNLSFSSDERQEQKNIEIESRIRGLLQKFKDQALSADKFKSEYQKLQKDYDLMGTQNTHLIREICGQIGLAKNNQALFEVLAEFKVADLEGLTKVLQEFQTALDTAAGQRRKILKDQLAKTHFISGSAVVPNLENDGEWQKAAGEIQAKYNRLLDEEKARLTAK